MKFIKSYWIWLLIIFILPLIIVNSFNYGDNENILTLKLQNLLNIFSLNFTFHRFGIEFYFLILTPIGLIFAIIQWITNNNQQRKSDINGLLEEIRHNIDTTEYFNYYIKFEKKELFQFIYDELKSNDKFFIYKNKNKCKENEFSKYKYFNDEIIDRVLIISQYNIFLKTAYFYYLRKDFITSSLTNKTYFNLKTPRIFLNLRYLNSSILQYNDSLKEYNNIVENTIKKGQNDEITIEGYFIILLEAYKNFVLYRLYFILIDLLITADKKDIIDQKFYNEIMSNINLVENKKILNFIKRIFNKKKEKTVNISINGFM